MMSANVSPDQVKTARPDHPINDLAARRWSPYSYTPKPVPEADLRSLFEAARWAPSSYNEQPWRYIVALRTDKEEFDKLLACLTEGNQEWAKHVSVLALGVISKSFKKNGKPNRHAGHDLGQATATLLHEATARGIHVHQMSGILPQKARQIYDIPDDYEAFTGIAIGYAGDNEDTDPVFGERDRNERTRKPLSEIVFEGTWEKTHRLF